MLDLDIGLGGYEKSKRSIAWVTTAWDLELKFFNLSFTGLSRAIFLTTVYRDLPVFLRNAEEQGKEIGPTLQHAGTMCFYFCTCFDLMTYQFQTSPMR